MSCDLSQVYSATYSNVPVFEFVHDEGPIMRRKSDLWINATHILKIAKFPKARRTRILEKDVQKGIHEKVQGGYGKYQGTYVPLERGKELAASFGVYDVLKPIFDFEFIEGKSLTPPPAPRHRHASASNVGRKLLEKIKQEQSGEGAIFVKRNRPGGDSEASPKRKVKTKRVALTGRGKPNIEGSFTMPIDPNSPSMSTFSLGGSQGMEGFFKLPPLQRQDTEKDSILFTQSTMNVRKEDLEPESSDKLSLPPNHADQKFGLRSCEEELMTGRELFGSKDFSASRESFDRFGNPPSRGFDSTAPSNELPMILGSESFRSYPSLRHSQSHSNSINLKGDPESIEYFTILLNYLLEENPTLSQTGRPKAQAMNLPSKVLNPPQPLSRVNIEQAIDSDGNTIFHWACAIANVAMIEFLLTLFSLSINSGLHNFKGETALMFLVQFNNSYILNNFACIFNLLFDSVLLTDNFGRTVLHHIALACEPPTELELNPSNVSLIKETFAKYYFEVVLAKIIRFPEFQVHSDKDQPQSLSEDKKDVIVKFINYQDNDGNTALHIIAFSLARKCIRTFIQYHLYFDFSLRNLVNCTVEDYLASHNYILRLEGENDELLPLIRGNVNGNTISNTTSGAQGYTSQILSTKLAFSLQSSAVQRATEILSQLSFLIEKELKDYDEKILRLLDFYKIIGLQKIKSQKDVLKLFRLDYLMEGVEKEFEQNLMTSQQETKYLESNGYTNDHMIQEEIKRLCNDLCFQYLTLEYEFEKKFKEYSELKEKRLQFEISNLIKRQPVTDEDGDAKSRLEFAEKLQRLILKRQKLSQKIYGEEVKLPLITLFPEEFKENVWAKGDKAHEKDTGVSIIAGFPKTDKLYKYCKLISVSCGMTFAEVENSVDLIEQSLARTTKSPPTPL